MSDAALRLERFGVAFGEQVVLTEVSLELPTRGLTVLVGPAGSGKSTLLRTLAGLNDRHPSLMTWGRIGRSGGQRPALVVQHARFFLDTVRENLVSALPNRAALEQPEQVRRVTELLQALGLSALTKSLQQNAMDLPLSDQRQLAIARALVPNPPLLFADEPTAGLDDEAATNVVAMLTKEARQRSVVLVTHNQRLALAAGGTTLLLAGGRIRERAPTEEFFTAPKSELARRFRNTGGCVATPLPPAPAADDGQLSLGDEPGPTPHLREPRSRFLGPRGFFWIQPERLGGLPRPGIIEDLERDAEGLRRLGITRLVTLEESRTVDPNVLSRFGIRSLHFPVVDMGVPSLDDAIVLCSRIADWKRSGEAVALHCRAGLGRTGTLLACQLIYERHAPLAALETVRAINPRCIQSSAQVNFLCSFAVALEARQCPLPATTSIRPR